MSDSITPAPAAPNTPVANAEPGSAETQSGENQNSTATDDGTPTKAEVKEAERKFKLKFGKMERELSEKDVIAWAQKGWASDEKFQGAASKEKMMNEFIARFKDDPDALYRHLGVDPVEAAKKRLAAELKRKVMTPQEREIAEYKEELEAFRKKEKDRADNEHKEKVTQLQTKYEQQYDKEMSEAIMASGLPKTPKTVKRCAEIAYRNLQQGYELPWSTIMEVVRSEYQNDVKELFGAADPDALMKLFGDDIAKKLTSASLKKRVADVEPVTEQNRQVAGGKKEEAVQKYADDSDWEEKMKKFKGG